MPAFTARPIPLEALRALRPERMHGCLPAVLWLAGTPCALAAPTVGIVGTRAPGSAAARFAHDLARDLSAAGVCVVSGLARGIDAAAHHGALAAGGSTIGVLAGGHDQFYPRENSALADAMIAAGGAVFSAHEPQVAPLPRRFLERNGIIAALSDAIVVVEAPARSGSLNTASWAADAGIPVLAVPGDVERAKVAGCLELLREGAILARHAGDVLEALGFVKAPAQSRPHARRARENEIAASHPSLFAHAPTPELPQSNDADEGAIYQTGSYELSINREILRVFADAGDASLEELAAYVDAPVPVLLRGLQRLVISGSVICGADGRYAHDRTKGRRSAA